METDVYELRAIPDDEFRADAEAGTFSGHASAFRFVDDHGTAFLPGAFRKTIKDHATRDGGSRIPAVWFHDPDRLVGPVTSLAEDDKGLAFTARAVDDGATGSMVLAQLRGGSHIGMSFSFRRIADRSAKESDKIDLSTNPGARPEEVRVITEAAVREISPLPWTFASNPKATITDVRSKLPSLLDAIRSGSLKDADEDLVRQIVDAWNAGAAAGSEDHSTSEATRRNRHIEIEAMFLGVDLGALGVAAA